MIVRTATLDDVPEIVRLKALLMETGWPFPVDVSSDDAWRRRCEDVARRLVVDPDHGWFVVDAPEGGLAGCVSASLEHHLPGPEGTGISAYIGDMCTDPRHQGQGIGTALLERALAWLTEGGAGWVSLYSTESGRPLYEKYGFATAGSPFTHLSRRLDGIDEWARMQG